jgi:hypothetical protein
VIKKLSFNRKRENDCHSVGKNEDAWLRGRVEAMKKENEHESGRAWERAKK